VRLTPRDLETYPAHDRRCPRCRFPQCRRRSAASGHNGFPLPFCPVHLQLLPRAQFETLQDLGEGSPFDPKAVAKAEAAVERALRHMSRPPKGSRRC
jgi:hypothetical protein